MNIEKVLVEEFEFLENNGEYGLSFQLNAEPCDTGELIYDGRNCAILIRNGTKAYLFTNLLEEVRTKLMSAYQIMIIEEQGEEIVNAYQVNVQKVEKIPYEDTLTNELNDIFNSLKEIYGMDGLERIVEGMKNKQ